MQRARKVLTEFDGKEAGPMALKDLPISSTRRRRKSFSAPNTSTLFASTTCTACFRPSLICQVVRLTFQCSCETIERESDAYVYWREFKGTPLHDEPPPSRNELCSVRFFELAGFLGQKGLAWQWNSDLVGRWEPKKAKEIRPGMTLLLANSQGGYDKDLGWTGKASDKPSVITEPHATKRQEALNDELLSETDYWLSVPDHLRDAEAEGPRHRQRVSIQ